MTEVRRKRSKVKYWVFDRLCIGRSCFNPGQFQHRGATPSGSRNTGSFSFACLNNCYHGCPSPMEEFDKQLAKQRHQEGLVNGF